MPHFYRLLLLFCILSLPLPSTATGAGTPPVLTNPSACGLGLPIPDFSCNANHRFPIEVTSAPGNTMGVDVYLREVRLIVLHEWAADLDMHLISPSGVVVELSTDNGSSNDDYGSYNGNGCGQFTTFIAHSLPMACNTPSIISGNAPFIGEYLPEEPMDKFNDGSSPLGQWIIEICDDAKEHYGTLEFVELVFEATSCLAPALVTVGLVDSTAAGLGWLPGGPSLNTIVEYGPAGSFIPGSGLNGNGNIAIFAGPPVVLSGLLPSTTYEVFIRKNCGGGDFSANSCPVTFTTICSPIPATITENFDNLQLCDPFCGVPCNITGTWRNVPNDHFDWTVNSGPGSTTATGPSDDVPGGGNYIYLETSGSLCRNGNEAVLMSNCIEVHASPNDCDLSFNYILHGANVNGVWLQVTTDGGGNWQTLWQAVGNLGDQWFKQFIDLEAFDGQVVQFRFLGRGGNGIRGDIALDNINFYGSVDLGFPPFVKYRDADGDGYGNPDLFIATCMDKDFPGYVDNGDDCNDNDFFINPGEPEFPCNGIDENCNGNDDEFDLPPPLVVNDTVCSGEMASVLAIPGYGGQIFWYDAPIGGNLLHQGFSYSPPDSPVNNSPDPIQLTFYAEEFSFDSCLSVTRQPASITVLPLPSISTDAMPEDCAGAQFDLSTVNVVDANGTNGTFTFHLADPPTAANETSPIVFPDQTTTYFIQSTANGGCTGITSVSVAVKPSPHATILGDLTLCPGTVSSLTALDLGNGVAPVVFEWNNGGTTSQIQVTGGNFSGATNLFAVKITGANGCASTDTVVVETVTSVDAVQVNVVPVSTCNGSDGTIILSPLDGVPPFNYFWNTGSLANEAGGLTLNNLQQGAYSFTITDSSPEGCSFFIPVVVVNGPSAVVSIDNVKPVSCHGGNDGCIQLNVIGSAPVIAWSHGATGSAVCGLAAGEYTVTVTDGDCENILTIPVPEPAPLFAKPNVQEASCFTQSDGNITLTVLDGTPPYQFNWSSGQVTQNVGNLPAGTYSVTVTDARGCEVVLSPLAVVQPAQLSVEVTELVQPSCFGLNDGMMRVMALGGSEPFSFVWGNGGIGNTLTNLPSGYYAVSVTDTRGCVFPQMIFLPQPSPLTVSVDAVKNPDCNGINNGGIMITASGGNGGYTYSWNGEPSTEDLAGIGPGKYVAEVTDQLGCTGVSDTVEIEGIEAFQLTFQAQGPSCVGINDGFIEITNMTGGTAPYQFNWSTDESGPSIWNLAATTYSVTVVDAAGCKFEDSVTLEETQPLNVSYNVFSPACHGTATGQLVATVNGGVGPYLIEWSGGHTGNIYPSLLAGNYTATVTDNMGCKFYLDLIKLTEPGPLEIHVDNVESIACNGGDEGSIEVTVTGGTEPYNYAWSNNQTQEDLSGLPKGNYLLTVTDANSCVTVSPVIEIFSPDPIQPVANLVIPPGCQAVQVDTVCVGVLGGVAPYQFVWDTGDTTTCLIGAPSGDYHVTITDAVGCTQELMSIKVPDESFPVVAQAVPIQAVQICSGSATGEVSAVIQGGAGPFQFIWSNGIIGNTAGDTVSIQNLSTGQYNVTITDAGGCTAVSPWMEVTDGGFIAVTAPGHQIQHLACKQGADGVININVSGGLPAYHFIWLNTAGDTVAQTEDVAGLVAGTYTVVVADNIGCTGNLVIELLEPDAVLTLDSPPPVVQHVNCFGSNNGKVNISPSGGIPPYHFLWSNGKMTEDISELGPGNYIVTITDSNACVLVSPVFQVQAPESPIFMAASEVTHLSCFGGNDGNIDIQIEGGTPPYSYNWNQQSVNEDLADVPAGHYQLTVFDTNSCPFDTSFVLTQPDSMQMTADAFPALAGQSNGVIIPSATGGTGPYTFQLSTGQSGDTLANLAPGVYELTVQDAHFCETTIWVEIGTLVSVVENELAALFTLFPNPTTGQARLGISAGQPFDFTVKVFNPLGQCVLSEKEGKMTEGTVSFDLSGHATGVYVVVVVVEGRAVYQTKLVVVR